MAACRMASQPPSRCQESCSARQLMQPCQAQHTRCPCSGGSSPRGRLMPAPLPPPLGHPQVWTGPMSLACTRSRPSSRLSSTFRSCFVVSCMAIGHSYLMHRTCTATVRILEVISSCQYLYREVHQRLLNNGSWHDLFRPSKTSHANLLPRSCLQSLTKLPKLDQDQDSAVLPVIT